MNILKTKSEHPYSVRKVFPTAKHFEFDEYAQHSKTKTVTLQNLLSNYLIKDTKEMLLYGKFRRLTNSIENNFTKKNFMMNNAYHYQ